MTRPKGTYNISSNFEVKKKAPFDARQVVPTFADLTDPSSWADVDGNVWLFNGAIVGVAEDPSTTLRGIYLLIDADNYQNNGSWIKTSSGGGGGTTLGENIGDGDASIFAQKSGDYLQFRELKAGPGVTIDVSNNTIVIDASGTGSTYNSTLDPSLESPSTVGGIPSGTTVGDLLGTTFTGFVDDLLFPTVNPVYTNPNNTFSDNVANLQEVADSVNIQFTANFSKGTITVSGVFQDYRSGNPNNYNYTGPGLSGSVPTTGLVDIRNISHTVTVGTQTWTNTVSYDAGPQPYDNKGNPYGSPLPAGTTSSKSVSLEGVYPLFGTTSSISNPNTQQSLVSMLTGNNIVFSMVAETGGDKQSFDIPDKWTGAPTSRPLQGVETYNTVSTSWEYEGGSAAASLTRWDTTSVNHTIQGILENYTRYTYNGPNRSNVQIRLKF